MLGLSSFAAAAAAPPSESRGSQSSSDILENDIVAISAGTQASFVSKDRVWATDAQCEDMWVECFAVMWSGVNDVEGNAYNDVGGGTLVCRGNKQRQDFTSTLAKSVHSEFAC